jgi:hypothetical protein
VNLIRDFGYGRDLGLEYHSIIFLSSLASNLSSVVSAGTAVLKGNGMNVKVGGNKVHHTLARFAHIDFSDNLGKDGWVKVGEFS